MEPLKPQEAIFLVLPAVEGLERVAAEACGAFARHWSLPGPKVEGLKTAVSEACMNAVDHGAKPLGRDARIEIEMAHTSSGFVIKVWDPGEGINQPPSERPDIDKKVEGLETARGWGLFLISEFADEVSWNQPVDRGHLLTMKFDL